MLTKLAGRTPGAVEAAVKFLDLAARATQRLHVLAFLRRNKKWLHENTRTWGAAGFALVNLGRRRRGARWLADWEQRSDVKPWMLCNLVEALRDLHRDAEAAEAGRRAMELPPDNTRAFHSLWLAADACREGDIDRAGKLLQPSQDVKLNEYQQALHTMVEGVVSMASTAEGDKRLVFREVRRRFAQIVAGRKFRGSPALRRFYWDSTGLVAKHHGGVGAKICAASPSFSAISPPLSRGALRNHPLWIYLSV